MRSSNKIQPKNDKYDDMDYDWCARNHQHHQNQHQQKQLYQKKETTMLLLTHKDDEISTSISRFYYYDFKLSIFPSLHSKYLSTEESSIFRFHFCFLLSIV